MSNGASNAHLLFHAWSYNQQERQHCFFLEPLSRIHIMRIGAEFGQKVSCAHSRPIPLQPEAHALRALKAGVELKSEIRAGHAACTIVDFTKEGGFDLVVLGSSGHSKVWVMFLGTTAEKVSLHIPCTVLIVR